MKSKIQNSNPKSIAKPHKEWLDVDYSKVPAACCKLGAFGRETKQAFWSIIAIGAGGTVSNLVGTSNLCHKKGPKSLHFLKS